MATRSVTSLLPANGGAPNTGKPLTVRTPNVLPLHDAGMKGAGILHISPHVALVCAGCYLLRAMLGALHRIGRIEIAALIRRGRLALGMPMEQWLADVHLLPELRIEPVGGVIVELAGCFDDSKPGDPADRIIAATALTLRTKLVTADDRLRRAPRLQTVW